MFGQTIIANSNHNEIIFGITVCLAHFNKNRHLIYKMPAAWVKQKMEKKFDNFYGKYVNAPNFR